MKVRHVFFLFALSSVCCGAGCERFEEVDELRGPSAGIVNGTPTNYESWKSVLGIWATTSGTVCTGTLIHPQVILTGGHCVLKNSGSIQFNFQKNPGALRIYGGPDISVWEGVEPIEYPRVKKVVVHPEWKGSVHSADLALLLLESPIDEATLTPFPLRDGEASVGDEAHLVGYGRIRPNDNTSDGHPHEASAEVVSIATRAGEGPYTVIKTGKTNAAVCSGDSGGPLFTQQDGQWVVTGVASMGDCISDNLNVNLENHRQWLDETLCELADEGLPGGVCESQVDSDDSDSGSDGRSDEDESSSGSEKNPPSTDDGQEMSMGENDEAFREGDGCAVAPRPFPKSFLTALVAAAR